MHPEPEEEAETKEVVEENEESGEPEDDRRFHSSKLTRKRVNAYFRKQKPYLQTDFKITDLAEAMDVNRSVMSGFINKAYGMHSNRSSISALVNREYGMNFSRLINRSRLKELNRLRLSPGHSEKDNLELVLMAVFSSYRSYLRVKREEDRMSVLKEF
ncbi:hypothetical protein FACS189426_16270 [Bacteroidia bacterium]|nr:hypothetical protein FACS189426_16270 [Bacteroidia bacterium]